MIKRTCATLIEEYLEYFPCVALIGARQSGKTTLLQDLKGEWRYYDLEKYDDYRLISDDPDLFFRLNPDQVAIDESQLLPELFAALRVAIDSDRSTSGRFVITGSSSPELLKSISESLAGRIGIIEVSPLSLEELNSACSPFYNLFKSPDRYRSIIDNLTERSTLADLHDYWFRGGYPEPWSKNKPRFTELWMTQYVQTYVERDVARLFPSLNAPRFKQFTEMLAGLSGQVINYSDVARALGVSQPTVRDYFSIANGTFLWRHIPPYERNVKKRIVKHPKGHLRDSGILHHLLRLRDLRQLQSHPSMGFSWEAMVTEELLRGLHNHGIDHDYFFYRTASGAEVDLVLEGKFGLVPIEIKYNQSVSPGKIRAIKDFVREHDLPYGIVIDNGESVRWISEKVVAIPFSFCV
jgi:predicted AAA+ superfamily ATPase